jgi:hypothetical protein
MSKPRRKTPSARSYKPGTPSAEYDFVRHCAKLLKARVAAGFYSENPALETTVQNFDPAIALIEIAADPSNPAEVRAAVSAKLMPYWHKEQSLLVKEAGGGSNAPVSIQISVAPWAAAKPSTPALPAPELVDHEEAAHGDMKTRPAPTMSDRDRLREQVRAQRETVIIEAPARPDQPQREVARVSQARGVVKPLTLEEKLRNKGVGRQHEAARETKVDSTFNLFGR